MTTYSSSSGKSKKTTNWPLAHLRHDLKTPVGHILGLSEMMMEDATHAGQTVPAELELIHQSGKRLLDLINERVNESLFDSEPADSTGTTAEPGVPEKAPILSTKEVPWEHSERETTQPGYLLIVDDDAENREVLARRLQRLNHRIETASSGLEALQLLSQKAFDLILLDIMMPGLDGYETLQWIKSEPIIANIPVVMVTALDEIDSVARCIDLGADDYLIKPYNATLLRARINASLREKWVRDRETRLKAELQENYEKLLTLEKMRDDLTGMIVHDLRTPLTSILSGLQILEGLGGLNAGQQEMLTISLDGATTLLGMINDLLDISKLESGSLKLDYETIVPNDLIQSALNQVAMLARNKKLNLVQEIEEDISSFSGDREKMRRVLVNILGNAVKFTPTGGTITIGAKRLGNEILYYVKDTGEGIPEEAFSRIFERFGQVENRKAGRKMSSGLGLTFCKMAVEAHRGRIWVESTLGIGSTFYFTVPVA